MISDEHTFQVAAGNGQTLIGLQWKIARPRAVVAIAHGINEHVGRYDRVAETLNRAGYSVVGADHRGHGRSAPASKRTSNISRFDDHVDDYIAVIEKVRAEHTEPVIVLGHSMGGLIAARAALRIQDRLAALVLSGPALKIPTGLSPLQLKLSLMVARLVPFLNAPSGALKELSRDPSVRQRMTEDELAINAPLKLGIVRQLVILSGDTQARASELHLPMLVMHGAADEITDPTGSAEFVRNAKSPDKEFVSWPGDFHEIFNELDRDAVLAKLVGWLEARFPATV